MELCGPYVKIREGKTDSTPATCSASATDWSGTKRSDIHIGCHLEIYKEGEGDEEKRMGRERAKCRLPRLVSHQQCKLNIRFSLFNIVKKLKGKKYYTKKINVRAYVRKYWDSVATAYKERKRWVHTANRTKRNNEVRDKNIVGFSNCSSRHRLFHLQLSLNRSGRGIQKKKIKVGRCT